MDNYGGFRTSDRAIGGLEAVIHNNQAKIGAEIKTIQAKMEYHYE
jgi:hypothetical protein